MNHTPLNRKPFKGRKHRRTQATDISPEVKAKVFERDNRCCRWCGSPYGLPEAHFISRHDGGLGIEQNVLTLCRLPSNGQKISCHDRYDKGIKKDREEMYAFFRVYLITYYADWEWDENKLVYKKGAE